MPSLLTRLRDHAPAVTPAQFLRWQPGCWVQYFDDTPAKDPARAASARTFDPTACARRQAERCAVCFSLQAFDRARTAAEFLSFRNLGVDVDLVPGPDRGSATADEVDERKNAYLLGCLTPFPLRAHWLIETGHGFHAVFRVVPAHDPATVRDARTLNRRLVSALRGDARATLLTQCLRVPGTYQFKDPARPFLCRLLVDTAGTIPPYPLDTVRRALTAWETGPGAGRPEHRPRPDERLATDGATWSAGLGGVAAGSRNVTAASLVGTILRRLPAELWGTAGWGGLTEWNRRNAVPLPERELRAVFDSIARRERARRGTHPPSGRRPSPAPASVVVTNHLTLQGGGHHPSTWRLPLSAPEQPTRPQLPSPRTNADR